MPCGQGGNNLIIKSKSLCNFFSFQREKDQQGAYIAKKVCKCFAFSQTVMCKLHAKIFWGQELCVQSQLGDGFSSR